MVICPCTDITIAFCASQASGSAPVRQSRWPAAAAAVGKQGSILPSDTRGAPLTLSAGWANANSPCREHTYEAQWAYTAGNRHRHHGTESVAVFRTLGAAGVRQPGGGQDLATGRAAYVCGCIRPHQAGVCGAGGRSQTA